MSRFFRFYHDIGTLLRRILHVSGVDLLKRNESRLWREFLEEAGMQTVSCRGCAALICLEEHVQLWQRVTCLVCGAQFEWVNLDPLELDWVFEQPSWDEVWGVENQETEEV
jgi:lysine biosynthesis protein LysW